MPITTLITENSEEIVIRSNRFVRRSIVEVDIGSRDDVITSLAESSYYHMGFMGLTTPIADMMPATPVYGACGRNGIVVCVELTLLPFQGSFERNSSGYYIPHLAGGLPGTHYMNRKPFPVKLLGGKVMFMVEFSFSGNRPYVSSVLMGLIKQGDRELRHFSYPNHYDAGNICMGREFQTAINTFTSEKDRTLLEMLDRTLAWFYNTRPNRDLVTERTFSIFRMNTDGEWAPEDTSLRPTSLRVMSLRQFGALMIAVENKIQF